MLTISYDNQDLGSAPYLALPEPFTSRYRLTLLTEDDIPSITKILSDKAVSGVLANVPQPYTLEDAREWYNSQPSNLEFEKLELKTEEEKSRLLVTRYPFSVIREVESGHFVGYFTIRRNVWEWKELVDPEERKKLKEENDRKIAGDESINYSIGYYLSQENASKGLMTVVVDTALRYAKQYMNAKHIQGICRADNTASRRVMEKNGFSFLCQAEMPIRGGRVELENVMEKTL